MFGYVKSNKPKKLNKVKRHLDSLGFELDFMTISDEANTIDIYTAERNYDIWRHEKGEDMSAYTKLKIKDVLSTATIDDFRELVERVTR